MTQIQRFRRVGLFALPEKQVDLQFELFGVPATSLRVDQMGFPFQRANASSAKNSGSPIRL